MDSCFEKWTPFDMQDTMYDVDAVSMGKEGFSFVLVPDGKQRKQLAGQRIILTWERVAAYQVTDECYREDCWRGAGQPVWPFFRASESPWLNQLRRTGTLLPEGTLHYLLTGTNLIADILADQPPKITIL